MKKKKTVLPAILALIGCVSAIALSTLAAESAGAYTAEFPAQHDARMKWFREARFGMFIHWGLYSQAAGEWDGKPAPGAGEWIMNDMSIPLSQYEKLVPQFNPVKFNARDWVRTAKGAGMKYIVITTKHHDGFALYPSALTDWCIKSTPFKRDPLKELAAACQAEGIKLCFYHSVMDWHHPAYAPRKPWNDIDKNPPDMDRYTAFMKGQLKELLTGYGPIGILWFDGHWEETWNYDRGADLYNHIRSLQPDIIINNRVGQPRKGVAGPLDGVELVGDYGTPEQHIPVRGFGPGVDWESCMTMNDTWGFKRNDHKWKSTRQLVRNLIDCASKGGNYLLNVGPTGEGLIPDPSLTRLSEIGQWMSLNGETIYGTTASPFGRPLPWGRCTTKIAGNTTVLYLHVFDWPGDGELLVPGLHGTVQSATLFAGRKSLSTVNSEEGLIITVPKTAPDPISSALVLRIKGALDIRPFTLAQKHDGSITLSGSDAELHGHTVRYESGGPLDNIGWWTDPADWADWQFKVKHPGKFTVSAVIAAPANTAFGISVGGKTLPCDAPATASYTEFKTVTLGILEIPATGLTTLSVRPVRERWQPMNLKSIKLTKVSVPAQTHTAP